MRPPKKDYRIPRFKITRTSRAKRSLFIRLIGSYSATSSPRLTHPTLWSFSANFFAHGGNSFEQKRRFFANIQIRPRRKRSLAYKSARGFFWAFSRNASLIDAYRFSGLYVFEDRFFMDVRAGLYLSSDLEGMFEEFFETMLVFDFFWCWWVFQFGNC